MSALRITVIMGVQTLYCWNIWNLAVQNQATDRAHRIGQENIVTVYKLIAKGTIEENIVKLQEKKMALADQIIGGEEMGSGSFSKEELLELLKEVVKNHKRQEKILFSLASCHPCRIPFFKPCCEKPHQYRNQIIHKDKYISKPGFLKQKGPDCC